MADPVIDRLSVCGQAAPGPVEVTDEEIEGAVALMESMSRDDLEGAEFRDTYTDALAEDVPVGEKVIPAGDVLIVSYGALGRDEEAHGPSAGEFDITRETKNRDISFGHGTSAPARHCPGWRRGWRCPRCTPVSRTWT